MIIGWTACVAVKVSSVGGAGTRKGFRGVVYKFFYVTFYMFIFNYKRIIGLNKEGYIMCRENKLTFSDFVIKDRFELNSYISYLFHQVKNNADQSKDKKVKH